MNFCKATARVRSSGGIRAGEGIRTLGGLLGRHIALNGVAALVAGGAKAVQLSSRQNSLADVPCDHLGLKRVVRTACCCGHNRYFLLGFEVALTGQGRHRARC